MNKLIQIIKDILYVSKLTDTKNKKYLVLASIILSQVIAGTDLLLIGVFAAILANQFTNFDILNNLLNFFLENRVLIVFTVLIRYFVNYLQFTILKKMEIDVLVGLKKYMFGKILEQKNYSTSDTYYYLNTLSVHISFFFTNFTYFINHMLQSGAYLTYLLLSDTNLIGYFGLGVIFLSLPIYSLIKAARKFMHRTFLLGKEANKDLVNAVENLPLIKILRMEKFEHQKFGNAVKKVYDTNFKHYQINFLNHQLPNFFTLLVFSLILNLSKFVNRISLDFLGVTVRLFQSFSSISNAINQVINSQIHIAEFIKMDKFNKPINPNYFNLKNTSVMELKNIYFKYTNSDAYIFENLNVKFAKNTHNIIVGSNGSGKSTLLGLIGNVLIPEKGTVDTFSQKFSYIGATPFIFETTLRENINYGNKNNLSDKEIMMMLKKFDFFKEHSSYNLDRKIDNNSLSSGQMQKLGFIRALLSKPEILLLDEAMANLDENSKELVLNVINDDKITVINSTHDPERFKNPDTVIRLEIENENRVVKYLK